jgi:AcrR family transcriptional regulator
LTPACFDVSINDMKSDTQASTYSSPLRDQQKADTRELILRTVKQLLRDRGLGELSLASVAREAGITERTVYRHFATREQLLEATWAAVNDRLGMREFPRTAAELVERPRQVFPAFDAQGEIVRAMLASPQGRELRLRVNKERQAAIRAAVRDAKPGLREPAFTRLCAAVQLLYSASGWATMTDYWDIDSDEAGRAASEAIALLLGVAPTNSKPAQKDRRP